jgi:hypothetical protein
MQKKITQSKVVLDNFEYPTDGYNAKEVFGGGKRVYTDKGNFHKPIYPVDGPWREEK